MGICPKVMGRAGSATCERDGVKTTWDRQGGAEDTGHQLVSWICMYWCAVGVSIIFPSAVFCEDGYKVKGRSFTLSLWSVSAFKTRMAGTARSVLVSQSCSHYDKVTSPSYIHKISSFSN